jgi:hypothetical protein
MFLNLKSLIIIQRCSVGFSSGLAAARIYSAIYQIASGSCRVPTGFVQEDDVAEILVFIGKVHDKQ